jgi:hypothetical protein
MQSLGNADLELEQLREMWQCPEPETDRAFALVFGSFGQIDDGDGDAALYGLWRRTLHFLRMPKHYDQLNRLARRLNDVIAMSGEEISKFLDC